MINWDRQAYGSRYALWAILRYGLAPLLPPGVKSPLRGLLNRRLRQYDRRSWLTPALREALERQDQQNRPDTDFAPRWPGQRAELACLNNAYSIMARETMERGAAAIGLELRRPFWTPAMVQFSFMVPKRMLYRGDVNRYTHRQAMRGLLPDSVLSRHSKAEFSVQ